MSGDALEDDFPLRVKGRKAQKASGDVCVLYDITMTLQIKISYIIGLDWQAESERGQHKQIVGARDRHI